MKVSDVIDRIKRIEVITDRIDDSNAVHTENIFEDIRELLDEYKDELLNKVVK